MVIVFIRIPAHVQGEIEVSLDVHLEDIEPIARLAETFDDVKETSSNDGSQSQLTQMQERLEKLEGSIAEKRRARTELDRSIAEEEEEMKSLVQAMVEISRRDKEELRTLRVLQGGATPKKKLSLWKRLLQGGPKRNSRKESLIF